MKEFATVIARAHYFSKEYLVVQTETDAILIKSGQCTPPDVQVNTQGFYERTAVGDYPTFKSATNRELHEHAAGYNLSPEYFSMAGIDPDAIATCMIKGELQTANEEQKQLLIDVYEKCSSACSKFESVLLRAEPDTYPDVYDHIKNEAFKSLHALKSYFEKL